MSKANNDRNIIRVGSTKRDDKQWDRLEDRLQTDPNLGGGAAELLVPGTYVPKVGLPPGVPYLYVIGNLLENYPIDLFLTGNLDPNFDLTLDKGNYFGLGDDAILGKSQSGEVTAYSVPAYPAIISPITPQLKSVVSAAGTLFELPYSYEEKKTFAYFYDTVRIREADLTWSEYTVSSATGYIPMFYGEGSDVSGVVICSQATAATPVTGGTIFDYAFISVDETLTVTNTQTFSIFAATNVNTPTSGIVDNGWMLMVSNHPGGPVAASGGEVWARPSIVTASAPATFIGRVFPNNTFQVLTPKNLSVGPTGVAWISYQDDAYGNTNAVVRMDLVTGQVQRYQGVLYDNTLTYPVVITDTVYINDNMCAVSGYYSIPTVADVPIIIFVALDNDGAMSVNMLEFPDYAGSFSAVYRMVKMPNNTLVFHLYSSALALTGFPADILFGITSYP